MAYVVNGYVAIGYIKGNGFSVPALGEHPLKFFVSSGAKTEEELKTSVIEDVETGDLALLYVPEKKKILIGGKDGFIEFLGGAIDIQALVSNQEFIEAVSQLVTLTPTVHITDNSGGILTDPTIVQTDENSFEVTVPPELVGTDYKIAFSL